MGRLARDTPLDKEDPKREAEGPRFRVSAFVNPFPPVPVESPHPYLTSPRARAILLRMRTYEYELKRLAQQTQELLRSLNKKVDATMATLADIIAKQDAAIAKATANTDALSAIKTVLDANTATIADLKTQLDAAVASGDPAALQTVSDNMDKILAGADNQAAAEAALANTGA